MHELATNASKYGSLSGAAGRLEVNWTVNRTERGLALELHWSERGGPAPKRARKTGFGSRLIEMVIQRQLNGEVERTFGPKGLDARLVLPLTHERWPQPVANVTEADVAQVEGTSVAAHVTSITASPSPSTVNTARSPGETEKVGMRLPVITTMPAVMVAAALGEQVREPGERRERVLGLALPDRLAVERLAAGHADDVLRRHRLRRADHHAAVPAVLHDHRDRVGLGVDRVAVLDQLVGRHRARDVRHHALRRSMARPMPACPCRS